MQQPPLDLIAYELATGAALRAAAARLAALPDDAPADALRAALGVAARVVAPRVPIVDRAVPALGRSIEAWSFAAGLREVAFVTVAPDRVDATLAEFPDAHVERRARKVEIGPHDRWCDDRARGEPRVELYVARDPAAARRAAALQTDDPTRHATALGALFGYPPCCVAAFVAQRTRNDNTLNRYLAAYRTTSRGPWPWQLNDLDLRLIAFYPCRYDCPGALAIARATVAAIGRRHPALPGQLAGMLAATVLYVDHDHQVWLRPHAGPVPHGYDAITGVGRGRALAPLTDAVALGDRLVDADGALELRAGDDPVGAVTPPPLAARFA